MNRTAGQRFLRSALSKEGAHLSLQHALDWFWSRQKAHRFTIERIPFSKLEMWSFHPVTGNLVHDSGKFFGIEGLHVRTNFGGKKEWRQPIINQPEVGILGVIAREFDGVLHFLMQVKMEPGNINMVQLSPTVQATRSNFTRAHGGQTPPYLEYFVNKRYRRVLCDSLQSEQGGRFLRKRNRNIIIEVDENVPVLPDYAWLTLGQIQALTTYDNIVNMDTRTVVGCIPFDTFPGLEIGKTDAFHRRLLVSALAREGALHPIEEIISWFTEQKIRYGLEVRSIPLKEVDEWEVTDDEIRHRHNDYFSIIACRVETDSREVCAWTQPLVRAQEPGVVALVARSFGGVLHFLIQAKVEPGNLDIVEMAPTVQCTTGNYRRVAYERRPPFLNYVLEAPPERVRLDVYLSEEGGRFYRETNRNLIVEAGDDFPSTIPDNYIWITLRQLKELVRFSNHLNVECRCILSCLSFLEGGAS